MGMGYCLFALFFFVLNGMYNQLDMIFGGV
jgi:hypothetical protein